MCCFSAPGRLENSGRLAGQSSSQTFRQTTSTSESTKEIKSHAPSSHPQTDVSRRTLQVDNKGQRSGRSPASSPGTTPTSPYSVPQIAPLPSSTLCPICNTTDLTSSPNQLNFNTCTQCRSEVCNQCGFNPNPHLTEVKEWLCLNCQMQRALGMDMTTANRSKSQQQLNSPALSPSYSPAKQAKGPATSQSLNELHQSPHAQAKPPQHLTQPQVQQQTKPPSQQHQQQHHPQYHSQQHHHHHQQQHSKTQPQQHLQSQPSHQPQQQPHQPHSQTQQKTPYQPQAQPKSHTQKPQTQTHPQTQVTAGRETSHGPMQMENVHGSNSMPSQQAKSQPVQQRETISQGYPKPTAPQEILRSSPQHPQLQAKPSPGEQRRSVPSSPAKTIPAATSHGAQDQAQEGLTGKLFGFGASLLNQATTLISVPAETTPQSQQSPGKVPPKIVFSDASKDVGSKTQGPASAVPGRTEGSPLHKQGKTEHVVKPKDVPKVMCPLCKTELNVGSSEPVNYNTCTSCKKQVCNMCGFNPTPHLVEKNEWLCLNCQTQRLLEGSLGDAPPSALPHTAKQQLPGSPRHGQGVTPTASPKHLPGTPATGSPRHQPVPSQTTSPRHQKTGPTQTPSSQPQKPGPISTLSHTTGTAGQQKAISHHLPGHQPETFQDKRIPESDQLRSSEQGKAQTIREDKKHPEAITQSKTPAESQKVSKQLVPKGKSSGSKKESGTRNSKSSSEIQKAKDLEDISKPYSHDVSRSPQSLSDTGYSSDGISSSQSEIAGLVQQEEEKLNGTGISQRSPPSPSELTKLESTVRPLLETKGQGHGDNGKMIHSLREDQRQKQRPRSLSITPEAFDSDEELEDILEEDEDSLEWENQRDQREIVESSDDFGSKLRHDYVEDSSEGFSPLPTRQVKGPFSDEEFMRRQILEMSAEEDNLEDDDEEEYNHVKYSSSKNGQKTDSEKNKVSSSKRRTAYNASNMYEENRKDMEAEDEEDVAASQGGLRRFKTIELNSTNSYNRDMDLDHETDISLDREPELEMESLTGSPEERSRGDYSSTLPATTPSYTSGTSPTSMSSLEEDSDSSPSRRQRLEEVKQQRKARHRSHGPLLPTIEDSSEEDELREEEELLREQEKMREVEQQRIRSTARKTKRDKEELRAQRRRERSKTPPSNLSPIEDASPTEELRQAAEMEELHRSSCSEYSPSIDSEAEGFEIIASKLYKSGSEYNLPTFMSLYSPTEKSPSSSNSKPLKSAEEVYEEMMRKAEMFQKQQMQQSQQSMIYGNNYQQVGYIGTENQNNFEYQYIDEYSYESGQVGGSQTDYHMDLTKSGTVYDEILQTSQNIARMHQSSSMDLSMPPEDKKAESYQDKQFLNAENAYNDLMKQASGALTPGTSPTQLAAPVSFASSESSIGRVIPNVRVTQHFSKDGLDQAKLHSSSSVPSTKTITSTYQYGKGSTTTTSTISQTFTSNASTSPMYSDVIHRSYAHSKGTTDYSSNEDQYRNRVVAEKQDNLQSKDDTRENVSLTSKVISFFKSSSPPLSPTSPTQSPTHSPSRISLSSGNRSTSEFSSQTHGTYRQSDVPSTTSTFSMSPMVAHGTQTSDRTRSPRLSRQQSSQEAPFMVITLASDSSSQTKPKTVSSSTSPVTSPTRLNRQQTIQNYNQTSNSSSQTHQAQIQPSYTKAHTIIERTSTSMKGPATSVTDSSTATYNWGPLPPENISLCRISSVPGTSRVEPGPKHSGSAVDLRTAIKTAPVIMTDHGMDLTSLATDSRRYSLNMEQSPTRHSTAVQPLIVNLNAQEQSHAAIGTATTVSITVASSMIASQTKQPLVYGDPYQNRVDFGQGTGSAVCLTQVRHVEQATQSGMMRGGINSGGVSAVVSKPEENVGMQKDIFARYNLPSQVPSMVKRDVVAQTSNIHNVANLNSMPRQFQQDKGMVSAETYRGVHEQKAQVPSVNLAGNQPHTMMVQLDEMTSGPVTKIIREEPPPSNALDLTGIKPESQVVCCDVVYKFPFGGSCAGSYNPSNVPDKSGGDTAQQVRPGGQYYGQREQDLSENYPYRESKPLPPLPAPVTQNMYEEQRFYQFGTMGRLHSSMSETNLSDIGMNYQPYPATGGDSAMDLTTMKSSYSMNFTNGNYSGQGLQYGSFTDLRQPTDLFSNSLPMRRYNSMSNIYSDYRYSRDLSNLQESNLAQYSATTAREISRMCAALNSMDQYGGRHTSSPDMLQYGPAAGPSTNSILSGQQGMASIRQNMMHGPHFSDSRQGFGNLAQYNISGLRSGAIRQMYPPAPTVRAADGMIYSTINTPIASTLPITTQPASVLRPMIRGLYRPYGTGNMTAVPLASLTRVPLVAPRMPLAQQYRYPSVSRFPAATTASVIETPVYLGKPATTFTSSTTTTIASTGTALPATTAPSSSVTSSTLRTEQVGTVSSDVQANAGLQSSASKDPGSTQQQHTGQKLASESQSTSTSQKAGIEKEEKEKDEERQRKQQEHILQIERERIELETLRQMRLHEELERERLELQRHREKEQMLVQRELQELHTIKHQVLQQQQEERQAQFALQREQLAQQRLQLEQIQQLQQHLQQQLEEQKRQKTLPPPAEQTARLPPQTVSEIAIEMQRTLAQTGHWPPMNQPFMAMAPTIPDAQGQPRFPGPQRPLTNSTSEMSLQTEVQWEVNRPIKKRNSMPRLRDAYNTDDGHEQYIVKKITDSSVQTDDEDEEDKFYMSRRRRTKRSTDCSVQTDDEDNAEWEQPVRRRRSRFSRHSDSSSDSKHDSKGTSSIAIQTISDCSVQTEPDQLQRVSPSIHITTHDPKVEIVKYISAPEKTQRGESLACQTEPETQSHGIVVPQLSVPTTVTPYSSNIQIVTSGPIDANISRQQGASKFEKKKPDPLEIGYQSHLPTDTLSQLFTRQPPKSPQVLYSPVSPLSPHRLLESTFTSSERLNKAHVTPQKHFTADNTQRQQILPRPIKTMQRSLSDPKPISPTSEDSTKDRFSLYQHQLLQSSQISAFQPNTLTRKVKRTLPSPPPEEAHLPLITSQAHSQMYMPNLTQKMMGSQAMQLPKVGFLKTIDHDLKMVEQESTKLRKQQAELEEEEKEIDAKLKYLELGITQRKETVGKDRGGTQDFSYLRCLGENRDYMSDSELNNIRISGYDSNTLLNRTGTNTQYSDFQTTQQFQTATSSYTPNSYQYTTGHNVAPVSTTIQQTRFQQPQYSVSSNGPSQTSFQSSISGYPMQSSYQTHTVAQTTTYQSDLGLQSHSGFRQPNPYQAQTTYANQSSLQPTLNSGFQPQGDTHTTHQKPRQTSLADLEHKVSTNYEVIANPTVVISSATPDTAFSSTTVASNFDQYKAPEGRPAERGNGAESPSSSYTSDSLYSNLEQNIPRNYVMIEDISELTKENPPPAESQKVEPLPQSLPQSSNGRQVKEKNGHVEAESSNKCCYSRVEEESEEDMYDHHSSDYRGKSSYQRSSENNGRDSGSGNYYYGESDSRHSTRLDKHGSNSGMHKHSSKNLAPAVVSSKRSKHRKQGMEQKISKFSPIEEAKDVESDLAASYPVTTSVSNNNSVSSRAKKLQDEITYGLKKNVYEQQKYYGVSSREMVEEDDRIYGSGSRSRSASSYGIEKSSRDSGSSRSKSYERDCADRYHKSSTKPSSLNMSQSRGRAPVRTQASEEESPVSPLGKSKGVSHSSGGHVSQSAAESCPQFCSSHSLPDVQEHVKEVPRTHTYKQEENYMMDDTHCVVSDSEAYHLGQEETDWFDKPREARSKYYSSHSSSQKKMPVKHTYHDYDEPPDEDMWQHDDYSQSRHSSNKDHRHGESGRHSSSRHPEDQSRRSSKQYMREQGRHDPRPHSHPSSTSSSLKKSQQSDSRTQSGYPSSSADYVSQSRESRSASSYHHTSESQKSQRQPQTSQQQKTESQPHHQQSQQTRQQQPGQQSRQQQSQQQPSRQQQQPVGSSQQSSHQSPHQQSSHQSTHPPTAHQQGSHQPSRAQAQQQQQQPSQQQQPPQPQQQSSQVQPASRPPQQQQQPSQTAKPQQTPTPSAQPSMTPKIEPVDTAKTAAKPAPQQARVPPAQTQVPAAGIKIGQKPMTTPVGTAGMASGQSGSEGESVFSKILPGGAAEQAGKLTEAVSAFGKKFSSFW
ncbi:protein bassoon [Bombina bombina]|uniref:protein bassoon n=1 Tax=Bombina bombina TaxID=8345 RepID=UPI00235B1C5F|nr:protein bassoon [Bombina bombina]